MAQRIFTLILLLCSTSVFAGLFDAPGRSQFVLADQAFAFDFQQNQHDLNLTWQIKDGYYLYRKQVRITPEHAKIADVQLPQGVWHEDEFYGKSEIYRDRLTLPVTINQASAGATLTVTYQGCADAGFCYPPETKTVPLSEVVANNAASQPVSVPQQEQPTAQLPFSALWALLIGIGIAFTPCVLPMYPLISGIVLGGKQRLSTARALLLTFIYVQGMALTYTALGLVVAAAGLQFQAALQHPYVLIGLAIVFTLLAMSMFGLFTLQLPSSLQTRLTLMSNRQQGGSPGGVFVMGAIAGLICSPCTAMQYNHDETKAKAEWDKVTSKPTSLTFLYSDNDPNWEPIALATQSSLNKLGINVKLEKLANATMRDRVGKGDYDIAIGNWSPDFADPYMFMNYWFESDKKGLPGNRSFYENSEVDKLLRNALATTDQTQRTRDYQQAQKIVIDDAAYVYLFQKNYQLAMNKEVKGFVFNPMLEQVFNINTMSK